MSTHQDLLAAHIQAAISQAISGGLVVGEVPVVIPLERPKNRDHGDYASSIALQLAKASGMPPREVAAILKVHLESLPEVTAVEIAGPGFLNITLNRASQAELVTTVLNAGEKYGTSHGLNGVRVNLEFISANPTGPLHLGHTRWAAVGDALGRVLTAAGAQVTREFYINDRGNQMDLFGRSLEASALGKPIPEDGYQGQYIHDIAQGLVALDPGITSLAEPHRADEFRERGYAWQLGDQKRVLETLGTHFDVWFSERSLHEGGVVEVAISRH